VSVVDPDPTAQRAPEPQGGHGPGAKLRILETANRLFYEEGIHSVGVDKLISASAVTKATFYKHYGAKDKLILEYLKDRHRAVEEYFTQHDVNGAQPLQVLRGLIESVSQEIHRPRFRGCPFINAAAEFSDPRHPARQLIEEHRDWYTEKLTELLRAAGHPMAGDAADEILLARDGAMTGGYAGDPVSATAALHRAFDRILREIP
jgi:AcrR family transcriptional regulator